jgi:hypothetical protein
VSQPGGFHQAAHGQIADAGAASGSRRLGASTLPLDAWPGINPIHIFVMALRPKGSSSLKVSVALRAGGAGVVDPSKGAHAAVMDAMAVCQAAVGSLAAGRLGAAKGPIIAGHAFIRPSGSHDGLGAGRDMPGIVHGSVADQAGVPCAIGTIDKSERQALSCMLKGKAAPAPIQGKMPAVGPLIAQDPMGHDPM